MKNFDEKGVILSENIPGFRGNEPLNDILKFLDIDDSMPETRRYKNNVKGKTRRMKFKSRDFGNIKNKKKNKSKDVITEKKENMEKESCTVNDHEDFSKYGQNQETETKVCEDQNAADDDTSSLPHFINSELVFKHTLENEFNNFYDLNDSSLKFDPVDDSRDFKVVTPRKDKKDKGKNYSVSRFNSPAHKNYKTGELCGSRMNNSTFNTSYVNNNLKFVPFYQLSSDSQNFLELKKYNSELSLKNEHSRLDNGVFYPGISGSDGVPDYLCPVCGVDFLELKEFEKHKITEEHHIKYLNKYYNSNRLEYLKPKNGIHIDVISDNPKIRHISETHTVVVEREICTTENVDGCKTDDDLGSDEHMYLKFRIENKSSEPCYLLGLYVLKEIRLIESRSEINFTDYCNISERKNVIHFLPHKVYDVSCEIVNRISRRDLHIPIIFEFQTKKPKKPDTELREKSSLFYVGKSLEIKATFFSITHYGIYIPGLRPDTSLRDYNLLEKELQLEQYYIPAYFQTLAYNNNPNEIRRRMNISPNVSLVNYQNFFKTLLWLEELQHELDVQFYKKVGITLNFPERHRVTGLLLVEFYDPGLAENRPCLMRNDRVFVCLTEEAKKNKKPQWYEGVVHYVKNQSVALGFDQERFALKFDNKTKFNLDFTINRFNFRVCHRAVDLCMTNESFRRLLFPPRRKQRRTQNFINDMYYLPDIILYDTKILNNYEQIQAIQHILSRQPYNYPYIIFGPPGTGKTVTIVETIKQILFRFEKSHVLACAPSNSAADIITEKLLEHFTNEHVFRMYSESRLKHLKNIPEKLMAASNYSMDKNILFYPPKERLQHKRVIVCTFITAAKIAAACFPDRHFTHVILDEAGHAMECEALVGIGGVLSKDGQLILAGDPHQLGPMVRNLQAVAGGKVFPVTGLDTSLLERVMKCRFYSNQESGYDPKYVTKLVMNYRSHKDILHIPNKLFYNSELQACGADHIVNEFANWSHLPTRGFPIIVHSVDGEDRVEHHSPSYHNPQEVAEVISYLHKLLLETGPENIGIITPYRLQVEKLKSAIERFGKSVTKNLKIGSVEDFQGEEKKVIIISTVRASKRHLAKDELFKLGFLRNPKRFNVAVTRAQCLLILICCTDVLLLDSNWKALIDYARSKGGYVGKKYREPKESIDEIIAKMENLDIRPKVGDISLKQIVEVPSWKRRT